MVGGRWGLVARERGVGEAGCCASREDGVRAGQVHEGRRKPAEVRRRRRRDWRRGRRREGRAAEWGQALGGVRWASRERERACGGWGVGRCALACVCVRALRVWVVWSGEREGVG